MAPDPGQNVPVITAVIVEASYKSGQCKHLQVKK